MRRERSLKKSSAVGSKFGGILQSEGFKHAGIEQLNVEHEGNTLANKHAGLTELMILLVQLWGYSRTEYVVVAVHQYR